MPFIKLLSILHLVALTHRVKWLLPAIFLCNSLHGQGFYFGADLSYVNELEDCGAQYQEQGQSMDPYSLFRDHGCNLVRLRLWHTPAWYDDLNQGRRYSDEADVRASILSARAQGMQVLLDFHLSDTWADPGHQVIPAAWNQVVHNLPVLKDSLYEYLYGVLYRLSLEQLLPDLVQIGNETNKGILLSQAENDAGWVMEWPRNSELFNTAIRAVRDIETITGNEIQVALHFADPEDIEWFADQFWTHGVQDFDILGLSYYAAWHPVDFTYVGNVIGRLKAVYPGKKVMLLETAYPWTSQNADSAPNLISTAVSGYPLSPASQKQWMVDLTQTVLDQGGSGVVYWEPAWVSTGCSTLWVTGSSWDNCTFFDFNDQVQEDGGIGWMTYPYEFPTGTEEVAIGENAVTLVQRGAEIWLRASGATLPEGRFNLKMFTLEGRLVAETIVQAGHSKEILVFDSRGWAPGLYVSVLNGPNGTILSEKISRFAY